MTRRRSAGISMVDETVGGMGPMQCRRSTAASRRRLLAVQFAPWCSEFTPLLRDTDEPVPPAPMAGADNTAYRGGSLKQAAQALLHG